MRPRTISARILAASIFLSLAGCGGGSTALDAGATDASVALDAAPLDAPTSDASAPDAGTPEPRLIALSREGRIASIDVASPWTVRESADLGSTIASARCLGRVCVVVHPSPIDALSVVDAIDLSFTTIPLERGSDPRDVAIIDDHTVVVSAYASADLLELDLGTRESTPISLAALADADGIPEASRLATCGRRVFAQLHRVEHATGEPTDGAVLAVIDLERSGSERVVDADPATDGTQGIALIHRPEFDMPVDCAAGLLYVAEPVPLMMGPGHVEQIDLEALIAEELPIAPSAELGGFEIVEPDLYWMITHTEFGPGPSSHLNQVGGTVPDTYNTFATEHVNDLALAREEDLLFFPDPCQITPGFPSCETGVHVFDAHGGLAASPTAIDVGFAPIEVAIAR